MLKPCILVAKVISVTSFPEMSKSSRCCSSLVSAKMPVLALLSVTFCYCLSDDASIYAGFVVLCFYSAVPQLLVSPFFFWNLIRLVKSSKHISSSKDTNVVGNGRPSGLQHILLVMIL